MPFGKIIISSMSPRGDGARGNTRACDKNARTRTNVRIRTHRTDRVRARIRRILRRKPERLKSMSSISNFLLSYFTLSRCTRARSEYVLLSVHGLISSSKPAPASEPAMTVTSSERRFVCDGHRTSHLEVLIGVDREEVDFVQLDRKLIGEEPLKR